MITLLSTLRVANLLAGRQFHNTKDFFAFLLTILQEEHRLLVEHQKFEVYGRMAAEAAARITARLKQ